MIDSPALVYHGAAAAARLNETAELAQKGSEEGREGEGGELWAPRRGAQRNGPRPAGQLPRRGFGEGVCRGAREAVLRGKGLRGASEEKWPRGDASPPPAPAFPSDVRGLASCALGASGKVRGRRPGRSRPGRPPRRTLSARRSLHSPRRKSESSEESGIPAHSVVRFIYSGEIFKKKSVSRKWV